MLNLKTKISKTNWRKAIVARNKKYDALSKNQKVVALCMDSLFNVFSEFVLPKNQTYVGWTPKIAYNEDMQSNIPNIGCAVCAKGSLLVSCVSFKNKLNVGQTQEFGGEYRNEFKKEFTRSEFNRIEEIFEWWGSRGSYIDNYNLPSRAGDDYVVGKVRMIHIFAMIIQFKGDVLKALSGTNKKTLDLKKVINDMRSTYVVSQTTERDILKMMKPYLIAK